MKTRIANLLLRLLPVAFLVWLFQDGLSCWFINDDFAWLGLLRRVHGAHDLMRALFEPEAQGTIRPWSEPGFFLLFERLFGLDNFPFRVMAFATMACNLLLVDWIVRRITQSRVAGFIAAMCWAANAALMTVMAWSSAYNQAMCACFLLGALALLIRYTETGRPAFWYSQLVVFVLGFGALEINVVYPAIAGAYALFIAPREKRASLLTRIVPLAAISVAYFLIHRAVAPLPAAGAYAIHVDGRIFRSVALYGKWSLLGVNWNGFNYPRLLGKVLFTVTLAGVIALVILEWRRRRAAILFFATWYFATLTPALVLPDHPSDYYLTIPLIGLAMFLAFVTCPSGDEGRWQLLALLPLATYFIGMIPVSRSATAWWLNKTDPVRAIVLGVEAARQRHPDKAILLDGIPPTAYKDSIGDGALYAFRLADVYLTPGSERRIESGPDMADPDLTVLDPDAANHAIENDQVVIYSLSGDHLRNVTEEYERSAPSRFTDRLPGRVDAGNPLYSWLLGPTWLPPESGVRWMPGEATVRLRGPGSPGNKIALDGFYPEEQPKSAPRHLIVSVDGVRVGEAQIGDPKTDFHCLFVVPGSSVGKSAVEIEIQVSPVERKDGQDYGVVFGKIGIRP